MSKCSDRRLSTGDDKFLGREGGARSGRAPVGSAIPSHVSRVRWTLRSAPLIALRAGAAGEDQNGDALAAEAPSTSSGTHKTRPSTPLGTHKTSFAIHGTAA